MIWQDSLRVYKSVFYCTGILKHSGCLDFMSHYDPHHSLMRSWWGCWKCCFTALVYLFSLCDVCCNSGGKVNLVLLFLMTTAGSSVMDVRLSSGTCFLLSNPVWSLKQLWLLWYCMWNEGGTHAGPQALCVIKVFSRLPWPNLLWLPNWSFSYRPVPVEQQGRLTWDLPLCVSLLI